MNKPACHNDSIPCLPTRTSGKCHGPQPDHRRWPDRSRRELREFTSGSASSGTSDGSLRLHPRRRVASHSCGALNPSEERCSNLASGTSGYGSLERSSADSGAPTTAREAGSSWWLHVDFDARAPGLGCQKSELSQVALLQTLAEVPAPLGGEPSTL
ncbi:hypothetical protein AAFF_G00069900 [Aldrovandia affinis]|uniref:Uncharacterized protein n=1 Tax=Aldrovandia affinis TaxID=143900 RepID=A0AAD7R1R1_9TELE|nr:hypothetical protein AAFF_G00069900 [Aldrovandia affinis]